MSKEKKTTTNALPITATAIKHTAVTGKELFYVKLQNAEGKEHFINIGIKTYNACLNLEKKSENTKVTAENNTEPS